MQMNRAARIYQASDAGGAHRLCTVVMSDDGGTTWRDCPNYNRRMLEHYRIHGSRPPGISLCQWVSVEASVRRAVAS